jgi:predicted CoA-substrate-specific enzyme activase
MGDSNMIVAGCDVGSTTAKAVIMDNNTIVSHSIIPCLVRPDESARVVMNEALQKIGVSSLQEVAYFVGTGYGRRNISFANENVSEITCHGVGAYWLSASVRTIIDIGGQDLKVIGLDDRGNVLDFVMNDKCAAGTGKFLENMARSLGLTLERLSTISLEATKEVTISSTCGIFAESEVVSLLSENEEIAAIANGIHASIATRLVTLVRRIGARPDITIAGGCAKNVGLIDVLEKKLGTQIVRLSEDPQIVGAIGAAILASEKLARRLSAK